MHPALTPGSRPRGYACASGSSCSRSRQRHQILHLHPPRRLWPNHRTARPRLTIKRPVNLGSLFTRYAASRSAVRSSQWPARSGASAPCHKSRPPGTADPDVGRRSRSAYLCDVLSNHQHDLRVPANLNRSAIRRYGRLTGSLSLAAPFCHFRGSRWPAAPAGPTPGRRDAAHGELFRTRLGPVQWSRSAGADLASAVGCRCGSA